MKKLMKQDILPIVWKKLERRYGPIKLLSGQGILKGERVEFELGGKITRCVIKTSTEGRISFGKKNGAWSGLDSSDFAIVVAPHEAEHPHMVSMFDHEAMEEVFDANQKAQEKAGMGELPNWIAPFHEDGRGPRGVGDGFANRAVWSEPLSDEGTSNDAAILSADTSVRALTIEDAKLGLARTYNVPPAAIEISIRW